MAIDGPLIYKETMRSSEKEEWKRAVKKTQDYNERKLHEVEPSYHQERRQYHAGLY